MARLFYMSLEGVGDWDYALRATGVQLRPYHDYLHRAIRAAERHKPVVGWREPTPQERVVFEERRQKRHEGRTKRARKALREREQSPPEALASGVWVILGPAPWRPEEPDSTFEDFLTARSLFDHPKCHRGAELRTLDFDREGQALLLDRLPAPFVREGKGEDDRPATAADPKGSLVWLRPNTYTLERQRSAVQDLENSPPPRLAPLVRLLTTRAGWQRFDPIDPGEDRWVFLRPDRPGGSLRDGTSEQREFVSLALGTPDFAILEGPPGSGKTTAICELIAQLAREGKRVLLVASTHVAVDNVLERVIKWQDDPHNPEKPFLPLRIGDENNVTLDLIKPWVYSRLLRTWRAELRDFLRAPKNVDPAADDARALLYDALSKSKQDDALANLLLDASNLVCGTTIGILQHPAIKKARRGGPAVQPFDVMIIDEASKTTFTEFLVPALYARRWIVVGDARQLSPYVEEMDLAENIRHLVPELQAHAAVVATIAPPHGKPSGRRRVRSLIAADDGAAEVYAAEAEARGVLHVDLDWSQASPQTPKLALLWADLVIGRPETIAAHELRLPVDLAYVGAGVPPMPSWEAARAAWITREQYRGHRVELPEDDLDWASEVTWRLIRSYELRQSPEDSQRYNAEIGELMPRSLPDQDNPRKSLKHQMDTIRRVALPSILELLQRGFQQLPNQRSPVALTNGLPHEVLADRLVSLGFQHRMHPDISAFPRAQFYSPRPIMRDERDESGENDESDDGAPLSETPYLLRDASAMRTERQWSYARYARHAIWIDTAPRRGPRRGNTNPAEVDVILEELRRFVDWAKDNPHPRGGPWTVAALTFYRGQEALLRRHLQKLSGLHANSRNFRLPARGEQVHVTLCTVDRFQGHEADLVLLSFVKSGSVGFLNSPNRINVAITRARYQLVLVGHRTYFADRNRCRSRLLNALASSEDYRFDLSY